MRTIFWDFDGVLMNSDQVRHRGFIEVLKDFPESQVNQLMKFHQANGGLSRYVKFRHFFEEIRGESITEQEVSQWASKFSAIMLNLLIDKNLLIEETIDFVKDHYHEYNMHIVSGSDGKELNQICKGIGINHFFKSIEGSPTPKVELVANILRKEKYDRNQCVLIGDSKNDWDAAKSNKVHFASYNGNEELFAKSNIQIDFI